VVGRSSAGPWLSLLALSACAGPPPPPPTAVIDVTPDDLCAGDGFGTPISISARRSSVRLSLVPEPPDPNAPLTYAWRLEGAEHVLLAGSLDARDLTVLSAGDRPLHLTLVVTTEEGGRAETLRTVGVTFALAIPCDEGCPSGTSCVERQGEALCLPDGPCERDEECEGCLVCDPVIARCAPPAEAP
jgi:hypothetical protein